MSEEVLSVAGKQDGLDWSLVIYCNASHVYYALAKVGAHVKIGKDFATLQGAAVDGDIMLNEMIAEKLEESHAA